jgi:hypothetical protein
LAISYTVSYTFSPSTTISSSQVNTNFSDNSNTWNGVEAKTKTFSNLGVDTELKSGGTVKTADGTAGAPSFTFTSDTATGFYRSGSTVIGVGTGNKITGLANATGPTDAVPLGQIKYVQAPVFFSTTTPTTTTSSTFQSTSLTASITPTSASNRIKITVTGMLLSASASNTVQYSIFRGSTDLSNGNGFGSLRSSTATANPRSPASACTIDSPAATTSTTYTVKVASVDNASSCTWGELGTQTIILEEVV